MKTRIIQKLIKLAGIVKTRDGIIIPVTWFADILCKMAVADKYFINDRNGTYRLNPNKK